MAAAIFSISTIEARAVEISFNSSGDLNGFLLRDEFQWLPITWSSTGGVGNSGSLFVDRPHDSTYQGATYDMTAPNSKLIVSSFFKSSNFGPVGSGTFFSLGEVYLSRETEGWNSAVASVSVDILSTGVRLWGGPVPAGGGSFPGFSPQFAAGLIEPNRWYQLQVEYENLGNSNLGWDIEVNDYGSDGLSFVSTKISSQQVTPANGFTSDSTLYAGFTASSSGAARVDDFFAGVPGGSGNFETLSVTPTVDVQLTPGAQFTLEEGATLLDIDGGFGTSFPVQEVLMEFPIGQIPAGAKILSAALALDGSSSSGSVKIVVDGYAGDGLASTADVSAVTTELAVSPPYSASSDIAINLNKAFVESLVGSASHLGLRLSSLETTNYLGVRSSESTFGTKPTLTIQYELPGLDGDFDGDDDVDGADFLAWQRGESPQARSAGDLADWRTNFGASGAAVATTANSTAVPEPASLNFLSAIWASALFCRWKIRRRQPIAKFSRGLRP